MKANRLIAQLIAKSKLSALSEEEQSVLEEWIALSPENRKFYDQVMEEDYLARNEAEQSMFDTNASWKKFEKDYYGTVDLCKRKQIWSRSTMAVAAGILLLIVAGAGVWPYLQKTNKGKLCAIIKRSDGRVLNIYDSVKEVLAEAKGIQIVNEGGGRLHYNQVGEDTYDNVITDTIITLTGGQCEVTLLDGTKVWLNARSKFSFPSDLNSQERLAHLWGEAYFEVNPQISPVTRSKKHFIVSVNNIQVKVLGTRFNIMAYENEQTISTTLLEGAVKINTKDSSIELKPGQQANIGRAGTLKIDTPAIPDNAVAWKKGEIEFAGCRLDSIMRQATRWYDFEYVCEKNCDKRYHITLVKKEALETFLGSLESTGEFVYVKQGKKIIIR